MIVPCMVNSWLYCSLERNCSPGAASSARISMAIRPPTMKNPNEVTMYRIAMSFGSVVATMCSSCAPSGRRPSGRMRDRPRLDLGHGNLPGVRAWRRSGGRSRTPVQLCRSRCLGTGSGRRHRWMCGFPRRSAACRDVPDLAAVLVDLVPQATCFAVDRQPSLRGARRLHVTVLGQDVQLGDPIAPRASSPRPPARGAAGPNPVSSTAAAISCRSASLLPSYADDGKLRACCRASAGTGAGTESGKQVGAGHAPTRSASCGAGLMENVDPATPARCAASRLATATCTCWA